ncbi:MAG: TIR domain-containing protein [Hyphomonadaceae bacterium]|nr:TIR domain-containing protein [Hyphomonadaceae bacterium]
MPSVVIIHAAEDTLPARALAEKLRQAQVQVVLEKPPGEELRAAVKGAPVTIALWSPRSTASSELAEEVKFARGKSNVFHALMQSAQAPDAFRSDKSVNLTGWRGEDEFAPWRELASLVTQKAGVAPLPPPAPRPPSGFFQPGRADPSQQAAAGQPQQRAAQQPRQQAQQRAPQRSAPPTPQRSIPQPSAEPKKGNGMVMIGAIVFVLVAVLGGGGYWYFTQNGASATSAAWQAVDSNNADALRAFIAGDPGQYRDEAEHALADLEERSFESASDTDTIEAFEAFLNDFPNSEHATRARGRIAELRTMTPPAATPTEEVPLAPETDPDLLPPGAVTTTAPDTSDGPQQITPPSEENTPPADAPTN